MPHMFAADPALPYGPQTAPLRHFLRRLAEQPPVVWLAAARHHERAVGDVAWQRADRTLGAVVTRLGRDDARDRLVGPVLQLARRAAAFAADSPDAAHAVERLAEPALAAALALLVADALPAPLVDVLYAPFEGAIPRRSLADGADARDG